MSAKKIITPGTVFGRLIVLKEAEHSKPTKYLCKCSCGQERSILSWSLRSGVTSSCGCLRLDLLRKSITVHGHGSAQKGRSRSYSTWGAMIARCENTNNKRFDQYGGRGIKVCERWRNSFAMFLEDMGERPTGKTIDREDSSGDYEPSNCRWATPKEQARNVRKNLRLTFRGETKTLAEWVDILGVNYQTLYTRLKHKSMSVEAAFTMPNRYGDSQSG